MRRLLLAALVAAAGCATDLMGPGDPGYDELCVVYVGEHRSAEITKEHFERCQKIEIVVVTFSS